MSPPQIISPFFIIFFKSVFLRGVAVMPINSPLSFSMTLKNFNVLSFSSIKVLKNLYLSPSFVIKIGF